ncbi:helix-turn-helix domain-containing protein [Pannonibacter tanglangensis]|uniref:Helix-turn-helix domain-containing protein n=1 Tax=Pannonibacter tanglangensis TaxID=2750084 RepID=A0ABW9ZCA3_9HYPH|nr:helix-turn-helix transcriptional regulator [Pannonibacter sp. XCT-34]NBN62079.1 helix-turn-helix domain-containing protein [Pannonibacter sp. XCT-34]
MEDAQNPKETADLKPQGPAMDTDFFKEALRRRQISQRRLAKYLNISASAVTKLLQGVRRMQLNEAGVIATLLGVPVSEVLERAGVQTAREAQCPVNFVSDATGEVKPRAEKAWVQLPLAGDESTVAVRCEDPMSARFGWVYYYTPQDGVDVTAHNRMCVVRLRDGRAVIAFCVLGFDGKTFVLQRENGTVETAQITSASPISWVKLLIS